MVPEESCLATARRVLTLEADIDALVSLLDADSVSEDLLSEMLCLASLHAGAGSVRGLAVARLLLARGVEADEPSKLGEGSHYHAGDTPLIVAVFQTAFVRRFWVGRFANVQAADDAAVAQGGTPLYHQLAFIAELVSRGASPARPGADKSAQTVAEQFGLREVLPLFRSATRMREIVAAGDLVGQRDTAAVLFGCIDRLQMPPPPTPMPRRELQPTKEKLPPSLAHDDSSSSSSERSFRMSSASSDSQESMVATGEGSPPRVAHGGSFG